MDFNGVPETLVTAIGLWSVAVVGLFSQKGKSRSDASSARETAEITARGPEWQGYADRLEGLHEKQQEWLEGQLAAQNTTLAAQNKKIAGLESDVSTLKATLRGVERKYRQALVLLRVWQTRHPDTVVEIPAEIAEDL